MRSEGRDRRRGSIVGETPTYSGNADQLAGVIHRVVVQQRQRLFRKGISQLLGAEDDVDVVAMATTGEDLIQVCQEHRPGVAVIEAEVSDWDVLRLVASAKRTLPHIAVVGLTATSPTSPETLRARRGGMSALVSRDTGIAGILAAVRSGTNPLARGRVASISSSEPFPTMLTTRELEILSLVGAGLTSIAMATRLNISRKTVENHKQRIFAKLGVQNQAHAVSIAMRTGLMRPERVMDLALGS